MKSQKDGKMGVLVSVLYIVDAVVTVQEQLPKERELCYTVYESGPQGF